jgi:hypothetical protein
VATVQSCGVSVINCRHAAGTCISLKPVTTPSGIQIGGYQVLVVQENPFRVFSADLPATTRRLPIPAEFLEPHARYKVEMLAIEVSGTGP